ncbi:MBL fold metallo-hydrolase [Haloarchaeobius amylolyticus]|uniref:MBL fold metallo-hydrolase n=1 Tax=Haloarchaeobius amylolyticus TaxID=1198296 RepID=A0ABD6BIC7_9EURY
MAVDYEGLTFERLGHASKRLETADGTIIYIDPWSEVVDGEPGDGDVVFVTHDDFDHYDPEAIAAVSGADVTVAAYEAIDTSELAVDVIDLPYEGETTVDGIDVRTVPAYNAPGGDHVDEDGEPYHADGEVIGLLLTLEGTTILCPSDTDYLPHHESLAADVLVPPIGGHFTMNRAEAADLARSIEPELVLPEHYDTFEPIETDAEAFAAELEADGIHVELF